MTLRPQKVDFNQCWQQLEVTDRNILNCHPIDRNTWTDTFSIIYKITTSFPDPMGDTLYTMTKQLLDRHTKEIHEKIMSQAEDYNSQVILTAYESGWSMFQKGNEHLNRLYQYLNTQHIKRAKFNESDLSYVCIEPNEQMLEIGELGLFYWRKNVIDPLRHHLVTLILAEIRNDRLGESTIIESRVHNVIMSFIQVEEYKKKNPLDFYQEIFEKPFLDDTSFFYKKEAQKIKELCNVTQYMEKVLAKLADEDARSRRFLHPTSFSKVQDMCKEKMVKDYLPWLHEECQSMVLEERRKDLENMYQLLKHVQHGLDKLVNIVQNHIIRTAKETVAAIWESNPAPYTHTNAVIASRFVEEILRVHMKYSEMIQEVFRGDQLFTNALDRACAVVINSREPGQPPHRSPELLASYCNHLLKRNGQETDLEEKLAASIIIFKYLDEKDVFQKVYSVKLGKRLLQCSTMSMDCEEMMINKLKQACGYEFTSKLHRMITDIKLSSELNNYFKQYLETDANLELEVPFGATILQAGAWPFNSTSVTPFNLPVIFQESIKQFEAFYNKKHSGRKLTWVHQQSTTDIRLYNEADNKSYSVNMGVYPATILFLFQDKDTVNYKQMLEITQIPEEHFNVNLLSLIESKILYIVESESSGGDAAASSSRRASGDPSTSQDEPMESESEKLSDVPAVTTVTAEPTLKVPKGSSKFSPATVIAYNRNFTNKKLKFKLTLVSPKEAPLVPDADPAAAFKSLAEDRKLFVQAAIVRIMKARKKILREQLLREINIQAANRFKPQAPMVDKCIESLIDKQYLEKINDLDEYVYIA